MKESTEYTQQQILTSVKHIAVLVNALLALYFLEYLAGFVQKIWHFLF